MNATQAKNALTRWAREKGFWVLPEFRISRSSGRVDLVLIPTTDCHLITGKTNDGQPLRDRYARFGLIAIEIKLDRHDFLRGKQQGQYSRYLKNS
ncbi:unnamed protein product, partial [marine sediment metagenome]